MAAATKPPGVFSHAVFNVPHLDPSPLPPATPPGIPIPYPNINTHFESVPAVAVINTLFHEDPIIVISPDFLV